MITVTLGCEAMVEHYRNEVRAADYDRPTLLEMSADAGVDSSDSPTKDVLAARLSAVTHKSPLPGLRVLTCVFPDDMPVMEVATTITINRGIWDSWTPGDLASSGAPTWVESSSPAVASVLAEHYGCPVGAPADVEATHYTENGAPGTTDAAGVLA